LRSASGIRSGAARHPQSHFRRYLLDQLNEFLDGGWREVVETTRSPMTAPDDLEAQPARQGAGHVARTGLPAQVCARSHRPRFPALFASEPLQQADEDTILKKTA
jgi:hypothetical protein